LQKFYEHYFLLKIRK